MNVLIDKRYRWRHVVHDGLEYWYAGSARAASELASFLEQEPDAGPTILKKMLNDCWGNFAFILEQEKRVIAAVDKIRSYPIFYLHKGELFSVSNGARMLKSEYGLNDPSEESIAEILMAGYVLGRDTIFRSLYQLQAGEFILWEKNDSLSNRHRYYLYYSDNIRQENDNDLIEELDRITDDIFFRVIEEADDAPIWVPLSGGLDSRLVMCKLKQLGYKNLRAFSYGPPGNHEAKAAKHVAEVLDVPWLFVPSDRSSSRDFFHSETRKAYWSFSDGLCTVPFMQDLPTLLTLRNTGKLPEDAVLINGQSGDFITGGHLPEALVGSDATPRRLLEAIIQRHFSLWADLKTKAKIQRIGSKIVRALDLCEGVPEPQVLCALYERWEWEERQCKYVVNGQRAYDFLGLQWRLPLWDAKYLHFWERISTEQKLGQNLYLKYLDRLNYKKLFKEFSPVIWRWPSYTIGVVPLARIIGLLLGEEYKERLYKYAGYFGHYGPHYAGYGFNYFLNNIPKARSAVSFFAKTWLQENDFSSCILH